jgi:hypothetical protein
MKSINIYRWEDLELACTFFPLRPTEEVLRTVVVNDAYVKQIETATLERVRDLLDYLLKS